MFSDFSYQTIIFVKIDVFGILGFWENIKKGPKRSNGLKTYFFLKVVGEF